jgi:hypothetical protein
MKLFGSVNQLPIPDPDRPIVAVIQTSGPHPVIFFPSVHTRCHISAESEPSPRLILRFQGDCIAEQVRFSSFFYGRVSGSGGHYINSWR